MPKINKEILFAISVITLITCCALVYLSSRNSKISIEDARNEIEYAKTLSEDVKKKPFTSKLPIKTVSYTIMYSSINKNFVIVFRKSTLSIDNLKKKYIDEIVMKLQEIGVDQSSQNLTWEIEK